MLILQNIGKNNMKITEQLESLTKDELNFIYEKFTKAIELGEEEISKKHALLGFTKGLAELVTKHQITDEETPNDKVLHEIEKYIQKIEEDLKGLKSFQQKFKNLIDVIN